jgi:hypothetical protein
LESVVERPVVPLVVRPVGSMSERLLAPHPIRLVVPESVPSVLSWLLVVPSVLVQP